MNKTKIEWVKNPDGTQGYTWNPITGCLNGCEYCYARKLANTRLKHLYIMNMNYPSPYSICDERIIEAGWEQPENNPFYPRFWMDRIISADHELRNAKPRGIFTCDMSDWCGIGIPESWSNWVVEIARRYQQHRFYLLTKQPQNLIKFSPFPDNCWVGITATNNHITAAACAWLSQVKAKVRFISIEPLLDWEINNSYFSRVFWQSVYHDIDWIIIGQKTPISQNTQPRIEWVREIVEAADKAGIPVFLKDNLKPLLAFTYLSGNYRQEMPK